MSGETLDSFDEGKQEALKEALGDLWGLLPEDLEIVDASLTSFKGRCYRDDWVGQAKALLA